MLVRWKVQLVRNIRNGMRLSADEIGHAEVEQGRLYRGITDFFESYDLLVTPDTVVPPFEKDCRYPDEVSGQKLETYFDWFSITYSISLTACPAISIPAGFTEEKLPVGIQIIAPKRRDDVIFATSAFSGTALPSPPPRSFSEVKSTPLNKSVHHC